MATILLFLRIYMFLLYILFIISLIACLLSCVTKSQANKIFTIVLLILLGRICLFSIITTAIVQIFRSSPGLSYILNQNSKSQKVKYCQLNDMLNVGNTDAYSSNIYTDQYSNVPINKILLYFYLFVKIQISIKDLNNLLSF